MKMPGYACVLLVGLMLTVECNASDGKPGPTPHPFVFVFVDAKTERVLGPFPYDRSVYAKAIERATESGAKGVVLKFFIDLPRTDEGDRFLAKAISKTKVVLQAGSGDADSPPVSLPGKFLLKLPAQNGDKAIAANRGGLPLPQLSAVAFDIGFINYQTLDRMPLIEEYEKRYVKSLFACCLELAAGKAAEIVPGKSFRIGDKQLTLDAQSQAAIQFPAKDDLNYISLVDFIQPGIRAEAKDQVVVIGYDGDRIPPVQTPIGAVRQHRVFAYALLSLYQQLR